MPFSLPVGPDPAWMPPLTGGLVVVAAGVLARMAAAVVMGGLPLAAGTSWRVQMALALALTIAATPAALAAAPAGATPGWMAVAIVGGEAVVGLALGLSVAVVLAAAGWAGQLLGSLTGLSWADDFGGDAGQEAAGVARLAWWLGLAGFVAAGGHEAVMAGLLDSVRILPIAAVGGATAREGLLAVVETVPSIGLSLATSLALPAVAAVIAFHLVAAISVRAVGFDPGQGMLQAVASLVLLAAICGGTDSWIGGFAAAVSPPLERCLQDIRP